MAPRKNALTRQDWIAVARAALIKSGTEGVKVDKLARKLKITRGSFYWHFKSRADLMDALLRDWTDYNRAEMDQVKARWAERPPTLADLVEVCVAEDPAFATFGIAVRIWARSAPRVAQSVRQVDEEWLTMLEGFFRLDGRSEMESRARAILAYYHPIGFQLLNPPRKREERLQMAPVITDILTARSADSGRSDAPAGASAGRAAPARPRARAARSRA